MHHLTLQKGHALGGSRHQQNPLHLLRIRLGIYGKRQIKVIFFFIPAVDRLPFKGAEHFLNHTRFSLGQLERVLNDFEAAVNHDNAAVKQIGRHVHLRVQPRVIRHVIDVIQGYHLVGKHQAFALRLYHAVLNLALPEKTCQKPGLHKKRHQRYQQETEQQRNFHTYTTSKPNFFNQFFHAFQIKFLIFSPPLLPVRRARYGRQRSKTEDQYGYPYQGKAPEAPP